MKTIYGKTQTVFQVSTIRLLFCLCPHHLFLGLGRTVAPPSAVLTRGHDQGLDPGPGRGLTLIHPVDLDLVPAPTVGPIHARLTLGGMDAALDTRGPGPGPVRDLTGTGALVHRGLLSLTVEGHGKAGKEQDPTGPDLDLAHPAATGVEAQVDENHLSANWLHMN